jgi:hypothetical protein
MMGFAWGAGAMLTPLTGALSERIGFAHALTAVSMLPLVSVLLLLRFPRDRDEVPVVASESATPIAAIIE